MRIFSEKVKYSIAAMFELAKRYTENVIKISQIAENQNIPQSYLEQLLLILKRANLVKSIRGARGGYQLSRSPDSISILDIINALEGPIEIINNSGNIEILANFWVDMEEKMTALLHQTLETLVEEEKSYHEKLFYHI